VQLLWSKVAQLQQALRGHPLARFQDLICRTLVTLLMLVIIRLGYYIALPGIDMQHVPTIDAVSGQGGRRRCWPGRLLLMLVAASAAAGCCWRRRGGQGCCHICSPPSIRAGAPASRCCQGTRAQHKPAPNAAARPARGPTA
jgi:hypothetical protein